ncbi:MAG: A24 family peptidase C-terminal domain-containing protein [candidate division Zixibacteria bacterium]|jgi:hypothetical protein|nr:A24 family peptidase C-terminal domain-containing protein [candidate division Zixibacteria bacterium]
MIADLLLGIAICSLFASLIPACYLDYRYRRIPVPTWKFAALVGIPCSFLSFLIRLLTGTVPVESIPVLIGLALGAVVVAFVLGHLEIFGGADSIAIIIVVLTMFYFPVTNSMFLFAFVNNTVVVCLLIFGLILLKNLGERNYRDLTWRQAVLMLTGTKIPFSHFTTYHGIVLETITEEDGVVTRRFVDVMKNLRVDRDRFTTAIAASDEAERYQQAGTVWVMYILPFIIPITIGLAITLGTGDVVQILLHR